MELVLLGDIQNGYASNWARIANTSGVAEIQIGDRFREQGFGQGAEELEVAGIDISVVGGASRLFFNRAANATQPEVHRLGAVLLQVGIKAESNGVPVFVGQTVSNSPLAEVVEFHPPSREEVIAEVAKIDPPLAAALSETATNGGEPGPLAPLKRGRGRPKGAKNKAKEEVAFPPGF